MVVFGEIQTGLIQHSHALSARSTAELLSVTAGERVSISSRPLAHARSPEFLTGFDCRLPTGGRTTRAVGTAVGRAVAIGGRVVQGSTFAEIRHSESDYRLPWSHYLSRPGVLEAIGNARLSRIVSDVGGDDATTPALNLAAVSERTLDLLRRQLSLDRQPPIRTSHTRLRWVAYSPGEFPDFPSESPPVSFTVRDSPQRTLVLRCPDPELRFVATLCEDIAVHDWLVTNLSDLLERAGIGSRARPEIIARLQPAIDHLIPLWMPSVRVEPSLRDVWQALEAKPGFTRQWDNLVQRVRDQVAVAAVAANPAHRPRVSEESVGQ